MSSEIVYGVELLFASRTEVVDLALNGIAATFAAAMLKELNLRTALAITQITGDFLDEARR